MSDSKIKSAVKAAKDDTVKAINEVSKNLSKAAEPTVASVKEGISEMQNKMQPTAKKAKEAAQKAIEKTEPALNVAKETISKAKKQAAAALVPEVYVEFGTTQYTCTDIIARCKNDFKSKHKGAIRSCKIYIKPADKAAYYVINKIEDKIDIY